MIKIFKKNKQGLHELIFDKTTYLHFVKYNWHIKKSRHTFYLNRHCKNKTVDFHRSFMKLKTTTKVVDHVNGNGLDNRSCNLRIATPHQNLMNQRKIKGSSKFKGVTWRKQINKWEARIIYNRQYKYLGCYTKERDAAIAYDKAAKKYFKEFARLNKDIK